MQIYQAVRIIMGEDGTTIGKARLRALRENANFFREELKRFGCHVLGQLDSPIIPIMLYMPAKVSAFSRECYERGLAVVVVGYPATRLLEARARFCISAAHTREDLLEALHQIEQVLIDVGVRYGKRMLG
jgi:serine palmitoyltransferase